MNVFIGLYSSPTTGRWIDCEDEDPVDYAAELSAAHNGAEVGIMDVEGPAFLERQPIASLAEWQSLLDEYDTELVEAAYDHIGASDVGSVRTAIENASTYSDADECVDEWCDAHDLPDNVRNYIDGEALVRDMTFEGWTKLDSGMLVYFG